MTVSRRCADVSELLSVAEAGLGDTAVVSSDLRGLDLAVVNRLRANRIRVIGVHPADDEGAERRLRQLTVTTTLPVDADADRWTTSFAEGHGAVDELEAALQASGAVGAVGAVEPWRRTAAGSPGDLRGPRRRRRRLPQRTGRRTGAAAGARVAGRRRGAVDGTADAARPAAGVGGDDPSGGLTSRPGPGSRRRRVGTHRRSRTHDGRDDAGRGDRTAVASRCCSSTPTPTAAAWRRPWGCSTRRPGSPPPAARPTRACSTCPRSSRIAPEVVPGLRVLTGLPKAERWPEVRAAALERVLELSRSLVQVVVVDCGFCLEDDEELSYDTVAPRRNEATLTSLAASDVVVAVGGADPVALQRFVRGLQELGTVPSGEPVPVVNRVRSGAVGSRPESRIADSLLRFAGLTSVRFVPDDPGALDGALLAGRSLVEHAPDSPVRRCRRRPRHRRCSRGPSLPGSAATVADGGRRRLSRRGSSAVAGA